MQTNGNMKRRFVEHEQLIWPPHLGFGALYRSTSDYSLDSTVDAANPKPCVVRHNPNLPRLHAPWPDRSPCFFPRPRAAASAHAPGTISNSTGLFAHSVGIAAVALHLSRLLASRFNASSFLPDRPMRPFEGRSGGVFYSF